MGILFGNRNKGQRGESSATIQMRFFGPNQEICCSRSASQGLWKRERLPRGNNGRFVEFGDVGWRFRWVHGLWPLYSLRNSPPRICLDAAAAEASHRKGAAGTRWCSLDDPVINPLIDLIDRHRNSARKIPIALLAGPVRMVCIPLYLSQLKSPKRCSIFHYVLYRSAATESALSLINRHFQRVPRATCEAKML